MSEVNLDNKETHLLVHKITRTKSKYNYYSKYNFIYVHFLIQ